MADSTINSLLGLSPRQLQIQASSMTVAALFRDAYSVDKDSSETKNLLEAYKSLRRALPKKSDGSGRHVGHELTTDLMG